MNDAFAFTTDAVAALGSLVPVADGCQAHVLSFPSDVIVTEPIVHRVGEAAHLCICLAAGAQASVQLELATTVDQLTVEVFLEPGAQASVLTVQPTSAQSITITQRSQVAAGAALHWQNVTLGSQVEQDLVSELTGDHAESTVDWLFYAKNDEKQRLSARNVFAGREGEGEITLKGVAENTAHVDCQGMIEIGLQGGGTDAYLTEDVLMLDPTAKVDAIPGLEIKTNDVKASHSATVSRVTPEDLFYFGARGIDASTARAMYITGFLGGLTEKMPAETQERVMGMIQGKYDQ